MPAFTEILASGESSFVEFKEEGVHPDSLAKEMASFANTEGGSIYIGVSDTGVALGTTRPDLEEWVFNIARNNVKPAILPLFEWLIHEGKKIGHLKINKDLSGPFSISGRYYLRAGSTCRECTKEELSRLFQKFRLTYFEETPVYNANESHFDQSRIQEYFKTVYDYDISHEDPAAYKTVLQNSGLLTADGFATVVGLVMFGKRNSGHVPPIHYTKRFLPQTGAAYAHYAGREITSDLLDSAHFEGTAPDLVEKIAEKVLLRLPTPSTINGLKREEKILLPRKVLREILVNAVTHRDYSLQATLRVFQFDDRLEAISPGSLANSVTVEKMKVSYSIHRNPLIVKFMENLRYLDGLGRGVPMIFREMRKIKAPSPEILASDSQVKVVLFFAPL